VYCASYSKHLSKRDFDAFEDLFHVFGVELSIKYSTLDGLVESIINRDADVRDLSTRCIFVEQGEKSSRYVAKKELKRILLIDEVDVFFSDSFYGATYNPISEFKSVETVEIMTAIWNSRSNKSTLADIQKLSEYASLVAKCCPEATILLDQHIRFMIEDVNKYNDPPYEIVDLEGGKKMIGYKQQDSVSYTIKYRYRTAFAYLYEAGQYPALKAVLPNALALQIPCGKFSYPAFPQKGFSCIMGVTGKVLFYLMF
jgi:hypothetical protein